MYNKIPLFRILVLFTLLCVTLTACTATPVLSPTATMKIETPTPSVTATATEAPPSPTATETPVDPNMPADATGKDTRGNYIKETAEGTYTWTVLTDQTGKEVVKLWTQSRINPGTSDLEGGIPLIEQSDAWSYREDKHSLDVLSQEGFEMPYFSHPDYAKIDNHSFTGLYIVMIKKASGLSYEKATSELKAYGTLPISFTNGKSEFTWKTGQGVLFVGMKPEDLTAEKFPDLVICHSPPIPGKSVDSDWTAFTDKRGRLVILSTTANPESLTPSEALFNVVGPFGPITSFWCKRRTVAH